MKALPLLASLAFTCLAHVGLAQDLPSAAKDAVSAYERETAAAKQRLVKQLTDLKASKQMDAIQVKAIERYLSQLKGYASTKRVTVKATSNNGGELGDFKKGDTLMLRYVEGSWAAGDKRGMESPDSTEILHMRAAVFYKDSSGKLKQLSAVPTNTASLPFTYVFEQDSKNVVLLIVDDARADNRGEVVYEMN